LEAHNFMLTSLNLWLRRGPKKICNLHWEFSKDMWHTTCTYVIQGDSWLLVVKSQIDTFTPDPSFNHNVCFKYSNGSYKPILNIYVLKSFQWYKWIFNPMSFDPSNHYLKFQDSTRTPTPKVGVHLGVCALILSHFLAFLGVWMWLPGCTLGSHLFVPLPWSWA
jgi:hypothetical protein